MISSILETRLSSWLFGLLDENRFDVVVCVERKATALLRMFLDLCNHNDCKWDWGQVLSSEALQFLPPNWLSGQRVLVLNEMIHLGNSTKATIDAILKNSPDVGRIETAAFAVHEDFETEGRWRTQDFRSDENATSPDHVVFRFASNRLYGIIREQLIDLLRNRGALLLDTEHLETTFKMTVPIREFIDSLSAFGEPIEYEDDAMGTFPGVTVREPAVEDIEKLRALLPVNTDLHAEGPKKVRLVRRGPNEFAFIPIWYPPISMNSVAEYMCRDNMPSYIRPALEQCPDAKRPELTFHLASLVAGLELLKSIWAGLSQLVGKGIEPDVVQGSRAIGSPLGHLRSLYPLLDFDELETSLAAAVSAYKDKATVNRIHTAQSWSPRSKRTHKVASFIDAARRQELCRDLLVHLVKDLKKKPSIEIDWYDSALDMVEEPEITYPFTWEQYWTAGEELGIDEPTRSILMDTAIDNAILKTGETIVYRGDQPFIERAYWPDSEFAHKALLRMAQGAEEVVI